VTPEVADGLDRELMEVKEMQSRLMAGDAAAREHILTKYPARIKGDGE
jgi:hypothetical protein